MNYYTGIALTIDNKFIWHIFERGDDMQIIESIEILFFRSIYYLKIKDLTSLNVISGKNDVGKSNILKALNLFFNGQTDWQQPLDFYRDFNIQRYSKVRESIKGRQFISVKITFIRGHRCEQSLPEKFTVSRKWYRDLSVDQKDDLRLRMGPTVDSKKLSLAKGNLSRFLNSIKYEYVPAIKEQQVFNHIMSNLQDTLLELNLDQQEGINLTLESLNSQVESVSQKLSQEFEQASGIKSQLSLPANLSNLYKAFFVHTAYGEKSQHNILLEQRGDGIRVRYIPSILNYVGNMSKKSYIWGFEEPENSVEYGLASKMADDFEQRYSQTSQIFVTSHSPSFFSLKGDKTKVYRAYSQEYKTECTENGSKTPILPELEEELGIVELQKELHEKYKQRLKEVEAVTAEALKFREKLEALHRPTLVTEGKTDKIILETAWDKLYPGQEMPFTIQSCDLLPPTDSTGGCGGCSVLKKTLEVVRHDSPTLVIGIFDNDKEGQQSFGLDKNFTVLDSKPHVKKHRHNKAFAVILPPPPGREVFAERGTLSIEFYFSESDMKKNVDGHHLGLIQQPLIVLDPVTGKSIKEKEIATTEFEYCAIDKDTKKDFAENVVPTFDASSFTAFDILFQEVKTLATSS